MDEPLLHSNHQEEKEGTQSTHRGLQSNSVPTARLGPKVRGIVRALQHQETGTNKKPALNRERLANLKPGKPIAPGQPPPQYRIKDRFVSLPDTDLDKDHDGTFYHRLSDEFRRDDDTISQTVCHDIEQGNYADIQGRITSYCVAETIERKLLTESLRRNDVTGIQIFPEVVYARHKSKSPLNGRDIYNDVFYFDYGTVVIWNMSLEDEKMLIETIVTPACVDLLDKSEVEVDEFLFHYTMSEKPHIQNDIFTINYRYAGDHLVKLSVSHALAQSTKLSVYEYKVVDIVEETKDLPVILASTGKVSMGRKEVAQLMGRVFLQKSDVNLLSNVLDTPDFFWESDIPDALQHLYEGCTEYLEYQNRVEVLNQRFQALQDMLDMIRDHQNNSHTARLEWIVIWLILIEIVIGIFSILAHVS